MATLITLNAEQTVDLGARLAREAADGWVFGLTGDLGAGKTQFVKGFARGLGIHARIQSPTFTLVHEYHDGRLPLFHLDLYRLENTSQILLSGLEDYFAPTHGISIIEWFDRWEGPPPPRLARLHFQHTSESTRTITLDSSHDRPGP